MTRQSAVGSGQSVEEGAAPSSADSARPAAAFLPRVYGQAILDELMERSAAGCFLDEIIADWGIARETFDDWVETHADLAALLPIARARQRGMILKQMREALAGRASFPATLADRLLALLENEGTQAGDACELVRVNLGE